MCNKPNHQITGATRGTRSICQCWPHVRVMNCCDPRRLPDWPPSDVNNAAKHPSKDADGMCWCCCDELQDQLRNSNYNGEGEGGGISPSLHVWGGDLLINSQVSGFPTATLKSPDRDRQGWEGIDVETCGCPHLEIWRATAQTLKLLPPLAV